MNQESQKIQTFMDLRVWQEAHKFVLDIYCFTKRYPKEELFALVTQLRRAAVSITSNIAEGFCRAGIKDKLHFYNIALASLVECQNQLLLSRDLQYIDSNDYQKIFALSVSVAKMLNALINKVKLATNY